MKQHFKKFIPFVFIVLLALIIFFSFYSINSFTKEYVNLAKKSITKDSLKEYKSNIQIIEDKKSNFYFIFTLLFLSITFILFFFVKFYYNKKTKISEQNRALLAKLNSKEYELKQSDEKFKKLISIDFLTGLPNQKYFFEMGNNSFHLSKRHSQDLSVIVLNIDSLNELKNNYGKTIENKVTKHIINLISIILRKSDIIAKTNEGFSIILNNTKEEGALIFMDKIKAKISENIYNKDSIKITPTISFCLTQMKEEDTQLDDLYQRASTAISNKKDKLINQVLVY